MTAQSASTLVNHLQASAFSYTARVSELIRQVPPESIAEVAYQLNAARLAARTVYTMGNGGSATTALHLTTDLSTATNERPTELAARAICLNANISLLSGVANDLGYEEVFVQQLRSLLREGDVVIGISASG